MTPNQPSAPQNTMQAPNLPSQIRQPTQEEKQKFISEMEVFINKYNRLALFNRSLGNLLGSAGIILSLLVPVAISYEQPKIASLLGVGAAISQALLSGLPAEKRYRLYRVAIAETQNLVDSVSLNSPNLPFFSAVKDFNTIRIRVVADEPLNELIHNDDSGTNSSSNPR